MPDYNWPDAEHRTLIGKRISRVDSPVKVSGRAKYTYDYHGTKMLFGKVVRSPYAKAKIVSIDTSAAEKMPGVKAVEIIQKAGQRRCNGRATKWSRSRPSMSRRRKTRHAHHQGEVSAAVLHGQRRRASCRRRRKPPGPLSGRRY